MKIRELAELLLNQLNDKAISVDDCTYGLPIYYEHKEEMIEMVIEFLQKAQKEMPLVNS